MFGSNEKKQEEAKSKVETILGAGTKVAGDIYTKGSLRIEGEVEGNVKAEGDLFVGESGKISTEIKARNVVVAGTINGNITASQKIEVLPTGKITGDIEANVLKIEEGAVFNGSSKSLKDNERKEINKRVDKEIKKATKEVATH